MSKETYVILDGERVPASRIDLARHRYLGMFRPPVDPAAGARNDLLCACGEIQRYVHEAREHYLRGCWDVPQYVTCREEQELRMYEWACKCCPVFGAVLTEKAIPLCCPSCGGELE